MVQQNSATAEQSAAASQEMSGQSELLEELISQFKLKDEKMIGTGTAYGAGKGYAPGDDSLDFGKY